MEQAKRLVTKPIKSFHLLEEKDEEPRSFQPEFQASVKVSQSANVLRTCRFHVVLDHTHPRKTKKTKKKNPPPSGLVHDCHSRSLKLTTGVSHNRKLLCYLPCMIRLGTLHKSSIITRLPSVIQQSTNYSFSTGAICQCQVE
jgi:hypothetical protein